jgi:PhnB protein
MQTKLNTYLNFNGNTKEAMEFYETVFGGKLNMQTFKEFHASQDPNEDDLIMHAVLETDTGLTLMAADVPGRMEYKPGNNFSLSLSGSNEDELRGYFEKLSDGGSITMALNKADWGDIFGMCIDKFGTSWLVNISSKETPS